MGAAFSYQITATFAPTSYGASGLPGGVSVNTVTGLISGTPTTAGTSTVTLSATNSSGTGHATLTLTVAPAPPVITSVTTAGGTVGSAFSYQITATNSPASYNATGLPAGVSVNTATGLISGTPTAAGTSTVTLSATNSGGTGNATLTLTLTNTVAPPVITSATTAGGTAGSAFSYQIAATNSPASYGATGLPAGVSVNTGTGLISGAPTAAGTSTVTLSATNSGGTGQATLTLTIAPASSSGMTPSPNTTLPMTSDTFSWPAVGGADQYWLDVGSQVAKGDYFGAATTGTSLTVNALPCDGRTVYVQVWAHVGGAWQTPNRYTYTAASGCSALTSPVDNSAFSAASVTFSWGPSAGADQYWLDVGNTIGKGDIFGAATTGTSSNVNNIPCDGRSIYVQVWTHIGGAWQNPGRYIYSAANGVCSGSSGIITPLAGSALTSPAQTFNWNPVSGADQYWLDVGSQVGQGDYFAAATTGTSFTVNTLPCDGRTVYVQLWVHSSGSWQPPQRTTYTGASGCAALIGPTDGTTFGNMSAEFDWSAAAGADQYWLDVGNSIAKGDIFAGATANLLNAVNNLPCDGRTIYVQLWTHMGGAWMNPGRYEFTASSLCGKLTTPVPGSTLSGGTVTFIWTPGTGVTAYWLDVGTVLGKGNLFAANVGTQSSYTVGGIPTVGEPIYVQLWSMINGVWYLNRYTYTAF